MPLIRNLISAFVPERQPELSVDPETGLITSSGKKPSAFRRWLDPESGARYENTKKTIALENAGLMGQNARIRQEHANKLELEKINTQSQKDIIAYQNGLISERELKLKQIEQANRMAELEAQSSKQKSLTELGHNLGTPLMRNKLASQLPTVEAAANQPENLAQIGASVGPQQSADIRAELAKTLASQAASESDVEKAGVEKLLDIGRAKLLNSSPRLLQNVSGASLLSPVEQLKSQILTNRRAPMVPVHTTRGASGGEIAIMPSGSALNINPGAFGKGASITPVVRDQFSSELPPKRALPVQSTDIDPLADYRAELDQAINDNQTNSARKLRKLGLDYYSSPFLTNPPAIR